MFEKCVFFNINALVRDLNRVWEAQFSEVGLTPPLGYMLAAIINVPGMSQKELSQELHLERSTVTRFLDSLESKGLIKREGAPDDARVTHVVASEKGKALKPKLMKALKKVGEALEGRVADQDLETLLKVSAKVRERLKT